MTATAYPLTWPPNKPRNKRPSKSPFATSRRDYEAGHISLARARDEMVAEIDLLGGASVVISTNMELRRDGLPYASRRQPDDKGVAVYFKRKGKDVCITCDRWERIACNMWSIRKSIEAIRGLERWGGGDMVDAAFTGFVALPSPEAEPWWSVLGFYSEAEALFQGDFVIKAKKMMQKCHPDKPDGDAWLFKKVTAARDEGLRVRDSR